jgi:hypothetical protein
MKGRNQFRSACARLEQLAPPRVRRALIWLGEPEARPVRVPVAILCIVGGCLSFLPGLGIELFPLGLMLLAHDVRSLRRPAGTLTMWLLDRYQRLGRSLLMQHARWTAWCTWIGARASRDVPVEAQPVPEVRSGLM